MPSRPATAALERLNRPGRTTTVYMTPEGRSERVVVRVLENRSGEVWGRFLTVGCRRLKGYPFSPTPWPGYWTTVPAVK